MKQKDIEDGELFIATKSSEEDNESEVKTQGEVSEYNGSFVFFDDSLEKFEKSK